MKLSKTTIDILKNFASINPSIQFKAGNQIRTKAAAGDQFGQVVVEESFPTDFAIYDLPRLLSTLSLFEDPELEFQPDLLVIKNGSTQIKYRYSDPSIIREVAANYDKDIVLKKVVASFTLTQENISKIMKAAGVLGVPTISISGDGSALVVKAHDKKNPESDAFTLSIGETDNTFNVDFKLDSLKMIPGDYQVEVSEKIVTKFSKEGGPTYFVAAEVSVG